MLRILFILAAACWSSLASASERTPDFDQYFAKKTGCFIFFDIKQGKEVFRFGRKACATRLTPCSTFKIPLSLMAFDSEVLKDTNTKIRWDGTRYPMETWNQDQDAKSWMRNSVVWFSRILASKLGEKRMQSYLKDFRYGNEDMTGGLTEAWLTTMSKDTPPRQLGTLKISADEQLEFMKRLWKGDLQVSDKAIKLTKEITTIEISPRGFVLSGKTGSGWSNEKDKKRLGWFVAHLESNNEEYLSVMSFVDEVSQPSSFVFGGPEAKETTKRIFADLAKW